MAWLNFTMPNQTVKNGLKAKKIKLPQMNFFLKKQLIKFPCTYWLLSLCKILKKLFGPIQTYEDVPFSGPKWPSVMKKIFWYKPLLLSSTYWPFSLCKIWKNYYSGSKVMRMHHFWAQNGPFAPIFFFFGKIVNIILIYLLAPFIGQNLNKTLPSYPELWGCTIFGPQMDHFP